jgi:hypothetical protein
MVVFLLCSIYLFAQPMRLSQKNDPMAKFGLNAEHLTSGKTRAADSLDCTLVGGWFTGPGWAVCVVDTLGDRLAYIGAGQTMKILNVNDSANPIVLGEVLLPCPLIFDIFVKDTLAYVANYKDGLRVINVSDPSSPFEIGFLDVFDWAYGVWVQDTFAYIADGDRGLSIINVANPASMSEIGNCNTPSRAFDVWVQDTFAYVADAYYIGDGGLRIINIVDPSSPDEVGFYDSLYCNAVYVRDTIAYAVGNGVFLINVAEPSLPIKVGSYNLNSDYYSVLDVWVKDTLAYLAVDSYFWGADSCRLEIVNTADPSYISKVGFYFTPGRAIAVQAEDNFAYVEYLGNGPDYFDGLLIVEVHEPTTPVQTGRYETGGHNQKIFIKDSLAYLANDSRGLLIINIANPSSPVEIGWYDTPGGANDVFVQDTFAYVADGDSGLHIINVSNPSSPSVTGFCSTLSTYGPDGVWVQDTFAYVADGDSGLRIIDVSDPSSPGETGFYIETLGDASAVWVQDSLAYVTDGDSGLRIIDVSDPYLPNEIGSYSGGFSDLYVNDTVAYLTSYGGLHIINISDPSSPNQTGSCHIGSELGSSGVWNKDNLCYVANGDSGLSVIDVSDPSTPVEVGFYRIYEEYFTLDACVKDSLIYVAYGRAGLYIFKYTGPDGGTEELTTEKVPFNISNISNTIDINYSVVSGEEKVKIEIFNILGQKVACPFDGIKAKGNYTLNWSGKTGIYFVRMEIGGKTYKQKALLLRQ